MNRRIQSPSLKPLGLALLLPLTLILAGCPPSGDGIQLGAALPLTGEAASYGNSIKNGAEVAVEVLNAKGEGEVLNLSVEDSGAGAAAALETAFSSSLAVIAGVTSDEALAAVDAADSAQKVLVSPTASSTKLKRASRYVFALFPSTQDEAVTMANFLTDTLQRGKVGILAEESEFGESASASFAEVFAGEVVATSTFAAGADLATLAQELKDAGAQGAYLAASGDALISALGAAKAAGLEAYTTSALAHPDVIAQAGDAAQGAFLTQTEFDTASEDPQIAEFVQAYEAKHGAKPDLYAAYGYDTVLVLAEAYSEWGGGPIPGDYTKGLRALSNLPGVTGSIQFREDGTVQKFNRVYRIVDGAPINYQEWRKAIEDQMKARQQELLQKMEALRRQSNG